MPHVRLAAAIVVAGAVSAAVPASATVVRALSLQEKAQSSPLIVRGRATRISTAWTVENGSVHTRIEIEVVEVLKGKAKRGQRVTVRQPGGRIGDFDHRVPGVSTWSEGEEAVLFLEPSAEPNAFVEIGIGIGKYPVSSKDGQLVVTHDPHVGLASFDPATGGLQVTEAAPMEPVPLGRFLRDVRALAQLKPAKTKAGKAATP
jgi:hypothetical protein